MISNLELFTTFTKDIYTYMTHIYDIYHEGTSSLVSKPANLHITCIYHV